MIRLYLSIITAVLAVGCFTSGAGAVKLKIATLSPEGSVWMEKMREGAEKVAQNTQNRVMFKFYPGGVMGNDKAVLRKIRLGQLHGGAVASGSLSPFFPANQIYAQPIKFNSLEEVAHVRRHLDEFIINGLEDAGFVILGMTGGGFSYIMSKNRVSTLEDLKNQKVWIPDNDQISPGAIRAFDITPIPLPISDVRTSLQSGLINTVATSPMAALILQWHTQIKYVTDIPLIYITGVLAMNKKSFNRLSPGDRAIVKSEMGAVFKSIEAKGEKDNIKAINTLKKRGIRFVVPQEKSAARWREAGKKASKAMIESGALPEAVAEKMDKLISEFRAGAR